MTKTKVTAKLRSGASVPFSPAHTVSASRNTPRAPQRTSTSGLTSAFETAGRRARQRICSKRLLCQATVRATNETMSTNEAAQANSHSGIGRSWRPTSAWPTTSSGASDIAAAQAGLTVISAIGTTRCSSSTSNTPAAVAGTSNSTVPPAATSIATS